MLAAARAKLEDKNKDESAVVTRSRHEPQHLHPALAGFVPAIGWLRGYQPAWLRGGRRRRDHPGGLSDAGRHR